MPSKPPRAQSAAARPPRASAAKMMPESALRFPFAEPPEGDALLEVAPGILWFRLPLPFALNHVNLYLVKDDTGYVLIDTGLGNRRTREMWTHLLAGALKPYPISRIVVTHFHPDHVGAVGWLVQELGVPLEMSATEYLQALILNLTPGNMEAPHYRAFFARHGLAADIVENVVTKGHEYLRLVSGLPPTYRRLIAGDTLRIGARNFEILTGGGHSLEQVMLLERSEGLFFASDQVLAHITPNVSVHAVDPAGDPLGIYIRSLHALVGTVPEDVLVLPGHQLPFFGLHTRARELIAHHHARCAEMLDACREAPRSTAELISFVFKRPLDAHQIGFAFYEILAHVNFMLRAGTLVEASCDDGVVRYRAA
ncbi:MAG: MBL fold metallo-hydrolase [Hyphomicrobiaceae bacterium]|nr:MBL fold metallo-hydrolase [Hyphomicrobiaceae bacterium]